MELILWPEKGNITEVTRSIFVSLGISNDFAVLIQVLKSQKFSECLIKSKFYN